MNPNNPNKNPALNFQSAEQSISYLENTYPSQKDKLSEKEMIVIKTLAASYNLGTTQEYINPDKKLVPFLGIREKTSNQIIFTVRKINNVFVAYATKAHPGGQHTAASYASWDDFYEKLDELFKSYSATNPAPKSGATSELSNEEKLKVAETVAKYGFTVKNVEKEGFIPYMEIYTSWGSRVYAFRKLEGMYYVINAIPTDINKWETINQFAYFHEALGLLNEFVESIAKEDPNKLSKQQINAVAKIGADYHFAMSEKPMEMEPDKHVVHWLELVDKDGKVPYIIGKDNHHYIIWRTFGPSWDKFSDTNDWGHTLQNLETFLKQWGEPQAQGAAADPTQTEHNGITEEEYNAIRDLADSFGDMFEVIYNKGGDGQTPYCVVKQKQLKVGEKSFFVSIGALGNYYQVNGPAGNALQNANTLSEILTWLSDKLSAIAGAAQSISADDMSDIINLMQDYKFNSASPGGGANNNYLYVKGKDIVDVNHNNFVTFTRKRVFGPIRHKPAKHFIEWFQQVYAKGEIPPDASELAARIINGLSQEGFVNKDSGQVIPHQKIYAIKWFRDYVKKITGGECSLAKSKWAIENLEKFLAYVAQYGLPQLDLYGPDKSGLFTNVPQPVAPPTQSGGEDLELTDQEQKELGETIGVFAPLFKLTINNDESIVMWFGKNIQTYKLEKISGTYKAYSDFNSQWKEIYSTSSFEQFKNYVSALCKYVSIVMSNSKMDDFKYEGTTPSADPNKLSLSEVQLIKKLIDKFGNMTVGTYKKQKLQEAKEEPLFAQVIISDPSHSLWFRIVKENGKFVFSKTTEMGTPFTVIKMFDEFADLFAFMDFYINANCKGEAAPEEKAKHNPPVLTQNQFEWLDNFFKTQKVNVFLKQFGNGSIGAYDTTHTVPGSSIGNPLFAIIPSATKLGQIVLKIYTEDNGMASDDQTFDNFGTLSGWIYDNLHTMVQLLDKTPKAPEAELAGLLEKKGFVYKQTTPNHNFPDHQWYHYENDDHEKVALGTDGTVVAWIKDPKDGEIYKNEFSTLGEFTIYLKNAEKAQGQTPEQPKNELHDIKEYLAYLGFASDSPSSSSSIWMRNGKNQEKDYVHVHSDGESKVTPSEMVGHDKHSSPFWFHTYQALRAYLTEKYTKGNTFAEQYFKGVLKKGQFKKKNDPDAEMGYVYWNGKLTIVPFPSGGLMYTNVGIEPKINFSYESTYDLARRVELWVDGDHDYQSDGQEGWSTGVGELDERINDVGFIYQGTESYEHAGDVLVFLNKEKDIKLRYHTSDKSASITFGPNAGAKMKSTIAFDSPHELIDYLNKAVAAQAQGLDFPGHAKASSIEDSEGEPSILEYGGEAMEVVKELKYLEQQALAESVQFQFAPNGKTGEIRVIKMNMLLFSVGKKKVGNNELWFIRQLVNDTNAYKKMDYSFTTSFSLVEWVKAHIPQLVTWKSVKDKDGNNLGTPTQPYFPPSEPHTFSKPDDVVTGNLPPPPSEPSTPEPTPKKTPGAQYFPEEHIHVLLDSKGFKPEKLNGQPWTPGVENVSAIQWVHKKSGFNFSLHLNAIVWHYQQGSKEVYMPIEEHTKFFERALKYVTPDMNDHELDFAFTQAAASRQEKMFDKMLKMAENVGAMEYGSQYFIEVMENKGFYYDETTHVWSNDQIYQVVAPIPPTNGGGTVFKVWHIKDGKIENVVHISEASLFQSIGPNAAYDQKASKKLKKVQPADPYAPSGEMYKTQDNESNSKLIWLNPHDEKVLETFGFVRVPQENMYYKNNLGDIVKFRDTGKADFVEFGGGENPIDTYSFDSIPHALKFIAVKYSTGPWSGTDYKVHDDTDHMKFIKLNDHDTYMLEQLGFKWNESDELYIKFYTKTDKPKEHPHDPTKKKDVDEAKKKKKKDPNQPELNLNPEMPPVDGSWEDYHEVVQFFDTGYAIWDLYKEDGHQSNSIETYEGDIQKVLQFLWMRWRHQTKKTLQGVKPPAAPAPQQADFADQYQAIVGAKMPEVIHQKFVDRGFDFDDDKGQTEYVKKVTLKGEEGEEWVDVKYDGTNYHIFYPYVGNGKLEYKLIAVQDPYHALNTIKKLENAEFGPIVQAEEDAIKVQDTSYFNAPNSWTKYNPYSPVVNPTNVKAEPWMDKDLQNYGFKWHDNSKMYWYEPPEADANVKGLLWEAVRIDANGTKVYFYPGLKSERRYFCSTEFNDIILKIEKVRLTPTHGKLDPSLANTVPQMPKGNSGKILDANNYPKAPSPDKDFSSQGVAIKLVDQDHTAILKEKFMYYAVERAYRHTMNGDQFKIFNNGYAWYKLGGLGEGMTNDINQLFDMLKSKYGALEWGDAPVSGHELEYFTQKLEKIGYHKVQGMSKENWTFQRFQQSDKKSSMNISERVVMFPNHTMTFYLDDASTTNMIGYFSFETIKKGVEALEAGVKSISLQLAPEFDSAMHQRGFFFNEDVTKYASTMKVNGLDITLTFYGDGMAVAQGIKEISGGAYDIEDEMVFNSFFNAILWADTKDFNTPVGGNPAPKPVTEDAVNAVMSALGMKPVGKGILGLKFHNSDATKRFMVNLGSGKVIYDFEYMTDVNTGEVVWGQSIFKDWDEFNDFLINKQKKPQKGKLPYTPDPTKNETPVLPTPMPWSGFDYENWAKGKAHPHNATIGLMEQDEKTMLKLGFQKFESKGVIFYRNSLNQEIYFYIDGRADFYRGDGTVKQYTNLKTLMEGLWAESMHVGFPAQGVQPKPSPFSKPPEHSSTVDEDLKSMGFVFKSENIELDRVYFKKVYPGNVYEVIWHHNDKTIEFVHGQKDKKTGDTKLMDHWTLPEDEALAKLHEGFDAQPKKGPKNKKMLAGTQDMPWSGTDYKQWGKAVAHLGKKGMGLHPTEEATLKQLGWTHGNTPYGLTYTHEPPKGGVEGMVFYPDNHVDYYSNLLAGQKSQTWDEIEMPIRWLWKNAKENAGHSGYPSIELMGEDAKEMEQMGFQKITNPDNGGHENISYRKVDVAAVIFWPTGFGWVWDLVGAAAKKAAGEPNPPVFQGTIKNCIAFIKKKYKIQPEPTTKVTGEVPYSGYDYAEMFKGKDKDVTHLLANDHGTMIKMGFEPKDDMEGNKKSYYYWHPKTLDQAYFFTDGHGLVLPKIDGGKPIVFKTVKETLQYLWDKYNPHI